MGGRDGNGAGPRRARHQPARCRISTTTLLAEADGEGDGRADQTKGDEVVAAQLLAEPMAQPLKTANWMNDWMRLCWVAVK